MTGTPVLGQVPGEGIDGDRPIVWSTDQPWVDGKGRFGDGDAHGPQIHSTRERWVEKQDKAAVMLVVFPLILFPPSVCVVVVLLLCFSVCVFVWFNRARQQPQCANRRRCDETIVHVWDGGVDAISAHSFDRLSQHV